MYSVVNRFATAQARPLNPVEKLEESVALLLEDRLSTEDYRQAVAQVYGCVESAQAMLAEVQFPAAYDAGPVLIEYATTGLECLAEAVCNLNQLPTQLDEEWARENLAAAREAYTALGEVLREVQCERYSY